MPNCVFDNIMARRSTRRYTEESVKREDIELILQAGINAPSAVNCQDWFIVAVTDKEFLAKMDAAWEAQSSNGKPSNETRFYAAPAVIFVFGKSDMNAGLAIENMCLTAESLQLGTVIIGSVNALLNEPAGIPWREALGCPEGYRHTCCISLGHKAEFPDPKPRDAAKAVILDKVNL